MRDRLRALFGDRTIRRVFRDAGLTTAASMGSAAFGIVRSAILARYLGVADFGRLAIVLATTMLVRQVMSVRVWEWTTVQLSRAMVVRDERRCGAVVRAALGASVAVNLIAAALLLFASGWIARVWIGEGGLVALLRLNAVLLLTIATDDVSVACLRVLGRFRWLAQYSLATAVLRTAAVLPAVVLDWGLGGVIAVSILAQGIGGAWMLATAWLVLDGALPGHRAGRAREIVGDWRGHLKTIGMLSVSDTLKTLSVDADPLIIGALRSPAAVGPYRAATNVVLGLHQLATNLYMVFYPEMTKAAAAGDVGALKRLTRQIGLFGLACGILAGVSLSVVAPWLVPALFGPEFASAVPTLQVMSWSLLILAVQWANPLFVSLGRPEWSLITIGVLLAVKIALLFLLVPQYSHVGAAIAYLGAYLAVIPTVLALAVRARSLMQKLSGDRSTTPDPCAASLD